MRPEESLFLNQVKIKYENSLSSGVVQEVIEDLKNQVLLAAENSLKQLRVDLPLKSRDQIMNTDQFTRIRVYFEQQGFKVEYIASRQDDYSYLTISGW
jgi:hypothetical protein